MLPEERGSQLGDGEGSQPEIDGKEGVDAQTERQVARERQRAEPGNGASGDRQVEIAVSPHR